MNPKNILIIMTSACILYNIGIGKPPVNIRNAVLYEINKYPNLEIQDLYKLAYQAAMGNEHMMNDSIRVRKYLEKELSSIDTSSTEPLIEYIRSDSAIARINLRAFKEQNGNVDMLIKQMMNTAKTFKPSLTLLKSFLNDIENLADAKKIPFKVKDVRTYFLEMEKQQFPAVHHSKTVHNEYMPAYRIVAGKQIKIK